MAYICESAGSYLSKGLCGNDFYIQRCQKCPVNDNSKDIGKVRETGTGFITNTLSIGYEISPS